MYKKEFYISSANTRVASSSSLKTRAINICIHHNLFYFFSLTFSIDSRTALLKRDEFFIDYALVFTHFAVRDHGAHGVDANAQTHESGDVGNVVRRGDFDDFHAAQTFGGDETDEF